MVRSREEVKKEDLRKQAWYRREILRKPRLLQLFIELTNQCNLSCLHCGSNCSASNATYLDTDLLIASLEEIAHDFKEEKPIVCFTGGEPLLHPEFERIAQRVNELGFAWGITTNGTLIDEKKAKRLGELKLGSISLSIDGLRDSHNHFRGAKNDNYQKIMDAVQYLRRLGIFAQITTVVHQGNICQLEALYQEMLKAGIYSWRLVNVEPIGRALESNDMLLNREQMEYLFDFIREKRFDSGKSGMNLCYGCSHYLTTQYERDVRDHCFMCAAGIFVGSILCNGDIYSCLDIERRSELVQGNIATDNFYDIWINKFKEFRADRAEKSETCRNCAEREFCNGDSMHTWDFETNSPKLCFKNLE